VTFDVRPAAPDDAPAIAALAQEVHALHAGALPQLFQPADVPVTTPAELVRLYARAGHLVLVAREAGRVEGYAHAEVQETPETAYKRAGATLYVHAMAVSARSRGRGVGRALLAALRDAAAARGVAELSLDVYAFNAAARAFYLDAGFAPLRERLTLPLAPR
jgi:GNAT superfamily N-acetyltransferase